MENKKKPKKRSLRLLSVFTVVLLLAFMAVPAFAAENDGYTVSGIWQFNEVLTDYMHINENVNYTCNAYSRMFGVQVLANCSRISSGAFDDGVAMDTGFYCYVESTVPDLSASGFVCPRYVRVYQDGGWNTGAFEISDRRIYFGDEPQEVSADFYFWLVRNAVPIDPFRDSVTSGLTVVIEWVGAVVSSLFSGELSGLLPIVAIPVAVTLLVLAIYFIRRSIWGA